MKFVRYILIGFIFLLTIPLSVNFIGIVIALINDGGKNTDVLFREVRGNAIILAVLFGVVLYLVNRNKKDKCIAKLPSDLPKNNY
jgi:hypothetical protein